MQSRSQQRIVTLRAVKAAALANVPWPYLFHVVPGMTIFVLFPFSQQRHARLTIPNAASLIFSVRLATTVKRLLSARACLAHGANLDAPAA